jgi:putative transcriptional regulator
MENPEFLTNNFLIAMPAMKDPNFGQTVTYICQHNPEGALGIVINRTINLTVGDVLDQMEIDREPSHQTDAPVHYGGPVQIERGFILHEEIGNWDSTLQISNLTGLTTSRDILEAIAHNTGPERVLLALGYAGWGEGQLEREISENAWLHWPADNDLIFSAPVEQRWSQAAGLLGVDLSLLSTDAGHA